MIYSDAVRSTISGFCFGSLDTPWLNRCSLTTLLRVNKLAHDTHCGGVGYHWTVSNFIHISYIPMWFQCSFVTSQDVREHLSWIYGSVTALMLYFVCNFHVVIHMGHLIMANSSHFIRTYGSRFYVFRLWPSHLSNVNCIARNKRVEMPVLSDIALKDAINQSVLLCKSIMVR